MAAVALRQAGGALVEGQAVDVAVLADGPRLTRFGRVEPGPFTDAHHARTYVFRHQGAHQDLAAIVEGTHQIPILNTTGLGIIRVDQDGLPIGDGELVSQRRVVQL